MEQQNENPEELSELEGLPFDEEKTEDIAEQIQTLLEQDKQPDAIELFSQLRPGDQGEVMEELPFEAQQEILTTLPPQEAADMLEHLEPENIAKFAEAVDASILSDILDEADSDVQADILRQLTDEQSQDVLKEMEEADSVLPLLKYADDSAGGRMVLEYVGVREDATAADAMDKLRDQQPEVEDIRSIFVVDNEERLVGELSLAKLALARPKTRIRGIMNTDIVFVTSETNQEECVRVMERYNLSQLPVVDEDKRLVGIILSEDVLEVANEEATEDMYLLAGIPGERISGPLFNSIRNRLPWLSINLGTTFLGALVIGAFESTIAKVVALAIFLPVVAGQGGIGGTQTLTLIVRSIALGEITRRGGFRLLGREIVLGILHGLMMGVMVGVVALLWKGNFMLGVVLALAMIGNMIVAALTGAGIPLLMAKLKVDPAIASAVIVTTFTDVCGFFLFLGLATLLITRLM